MKLLRFITIMRRFLKNRGVTHDRPSKSRRLKKTAAKPLNALLNLIKEQKNQDQQRLEMHNQEFLSVLNKSDLHQNANIPFQTPLSAEENNDQEQLLSSLVSNSCLMTTTTTEPSARSVETPANCSSGACQPVLQSQITTVTSTATVAVISTFSAICPSHQQKECQVEREGLSTESRFGDEKDKNKK